MAKSRARKTTTLDALAIAAGTSLGRLVAKIDKLTERRAEISKEIQHYARQAQGALQKAVAEAEAAPTSRKPAGKKPAARKTAAKKAKTRRRG